VFFPLYDFHHVPVPNECPWNPHLDLYNLQELMKTQNSARDWQCNQCWKRFYSEHALDLHMDNRHRSTVYTGPNATCLALFCPLLRCDVLHPDLAFGDQVFWDEALCTESRFEDLRVQCEHSNAFSAEPSPFVLITPSYSEPSTLVHSSTPTESHVLLIFLAITGVIIYYVTVLMRI
ncbi:zinc finger, C2H2 type, partial [Opisthorchis viverrini]